MIFLTTSLIFVFVPRSYLSGLNLPTAAGAVGGVANISLALGSTTNYFDAMTSYNAFLHTWSLGVEEQFYLIVPILLWMLWKHTKNHKISVGVLALLALISFVLAVRWGETKPTISFYSLPSRFWELALGALTYLASLVFRPRQSLTRPLLASGAWLGITIIGYSLVQSSHVATPYPGAILPVIGMILVLACLADREMHNSTAYRLLSVPAITYIGRISYSLYLWHWPVAVLLRWTVGLEQSWQTVLAVALTMLLSVASYKLIEQPFQKAEIAKRPLPGKVFVSVVFCLFAYSLTFLTLGGRYDYRGNLPGLSIVSRQFGWDPTELPLRGRQTLDEKTAKHPALIVVGDSHADAIGGAAIAAAKEFGFGVRLVSVSGCGFTLLSPVLQREGCRRVADSLVRTEPGDIVLFAALNVPRFVDQDGSIKPDPDLNSDAHIAERQNALRELTTVVRTLHERGVGVVVRSPEPLFHFIPFRCSDWFNQNNPICTTPRYEPREALVERMKPAMEGIETVQRAVPGVVVLDVLTPLCPGNECSIFDQNGHPLFADQDHLSGWGNERVLPELKNALAAARSRLRTHNQ